MEISEIILIIITCITAFWIILQKPKPHGPYASEEDVELKQVNFFSVELVIPAEYTYITMDRDGEICLHTNRPRFNGNCWISSGFEHLDIMDPKLIHPILPDSAILSVL